GRRTSGRRPLASGRAAWAQGHYPPVAREEAGTPLPGSRRAGRGPGTLLHQPIRGTSRRAAAGFLVSGAYFAGAGGIRHQPGSGHAGGAASWAATRAGRPIGRLAFLLVGLRSGRPGPGGRVGDSAVVGHVTGKVIAKPQAAGKRFWRIWMS